MEAKDRRIKEFVEGKDVLFTIPSYQRKYTWEFKKEVSELIDDIDKFIEDETRMDYFLGSVIVKSEPAISKNFLLVDGQQRITTFLLMMAAIRKCIENVGSPLKYKIEGILETEEDKFKLNRINDFSIIKKILDKNINQLTDDEKKSQYYSVYSKLENFFKNKEKESEGWIENFFEKGISNIILAVIRLNENEDEFLVFESINSKGKNLNSGDLIKNYVMMQLTKDPELEKDFENNIVEKLDEKELSDFYRQFIAIKTGKLASKAGKSLYYEFRKKFPRNEVNAALIEDLKYHLSIWKYLHETDFGLESYPVMKTGLLNYYSIIATVVFKNTKFENGNFVFVDEAKIKEAIAKISLVHILRTLGGRGRVESNRTFSKIGLEFFGGLGSFNEKSNINDVIDYLSNETGKVKTPTWNEVEDNLYYLDVYSNKNIIQSIFVAIEEKMSGKKIDQSNISIEHIYPQNPSEDWDFDDSEELQMKALLHTIGNISITNDNSALGNKIFKDKKKILEDRSYLKVNKMIYEIEEWNSNEIKQRANKLFELIKEIWSK